MYSRGRAQLATLAVWLIIAGLGAVMGQRSSAGSTDATVNTACNNCVCCAPIELAGCCVPHKQASVDTPTCDSGCGCFTAPTIPTIPYNPGPLTLEYNPVNAPRPEVAGCYPVLDDDSTTPSLPSIAREAERLAGASTSPQRLAVLCLWLI